MHRLTPNETPNDSFSELKRVVRDRSAPLVVKVPVFPALSP